MKTNSLPLLLLLCIGLLSWSSCVDDTDDILVDSLNYDGPNFTAPNNGIGFTTFAAYFPESEVRPFIGRTLESVEFWLERIPLNTNVIIYNEGIDDLAPGDEIYRINLNNRINNTGWITHRIPGGIQLAGGGVWLAVETEIDAVGQSIGCDQGRSYSPNGDRLQTPDGTWTSFNTITGSERINWNIRGLLAAE